MGRVTVVGERWARPGVQFVTLRPCEVAATCPVAKPCQSLEWGRPHRVLSVRSVRHDVCKVHEGGVRVAEVEPLPYEASLEATKMRGTSVRWRPPVCHIRACPNWDRCFPLGLEPGREMRVLREGDRLTCPMGHALVAATLEPARKG